MIRWVAIENDQDIKKLVHAFYGKVEKDDRLGYIFTEVVDIDWNHHLPRMIDFWSNLLFQTGRYHGGSGKCHLILDVEQLIKKLSE